MSSLSIAIRAQDTSTSRSLGVQVKVALLANFPDSSVFQPWHSYLSSTVCTFFIGL